MGNSTGLQLIPASHGVVVAVRQMGGLTVGFFDCGDHVLVLPGFLANVHVHRDGHGRYGRTNCHVGRPGDHQRGLVVRAADDDRRPFAGNRLDVSERRFGYPHPHNSAQSSRGITPLPFPPRTSKARRETTIDHGFLGGVRVGSGEGSDEGVTEAVGFSSEGFCSVGFDSEAGVVVVAAVGVDSFGGWF